MNPIVKIWILRTGREFVMIPMLIYEIFIRKKGVDKNNKSTDSIIDTSIGWKNSAMHGVMSRYEKSCVKESLPNNGEGNQ